MNWKKLFVRDENGYYNVDDNQVRATFYHKPGNYFSCWLETEPRVFFKENKLGTDLMGELITSQVASMMGISCVKTHPAKYLGLPRLTNRNPIGVLVEDFVKYKDATEVIDLYDILNHNDFMFNSIDNHIRGIERYIMNRKHEHKTVVADLPAIQLELLKRNILDFVLLQEDRKPCNMEYLVIKDPNGVGHLMLAPMFDNGRCLFFQDKTMMKKLLNRKSNPAMLRHTLQKETKAFPFCFFPVETMSYFLDYDYTRYKYLLAQQIEQNPILKDFLNDLEFIDPKEVLAEIEKQNPNFKCSKSHAEVFDMVFRHQLRTLKDCVFEVQMNNEEVEPKQKKVHSSDTEHSF